MKSTDTATNLAKLKQWHVKSFISKANKKHIYDLFWQEKLKKLKEKISYIYQHEASFYSTYIFASSKEKRVKDLLNELQKNEVIFPLPEEYQITIQGLEDYLKLLEYGQYDTHFFDPIYSEIIRTLEQHFPAAHPLFDLVKEIKAQPRLSVISVTDFLDPSLSVLLPKIFKDYLEDFAILAKMWQGKTFLTENKQILPSDSEQHKAILNIAKFLSDLQTLQFPTQPFDLLRKQIKIIIKIKRVGFHPTKECAIAYDTLVGAVTLSPKPIKHLSSNQQASSSNSILQSFEKTLKSPPSPRYYSRKSFEEWIHENKGNAIDPYTREEVTLVEAPLEQQMVNDYFNLLQEIKELKKRLG